MLSHSPSRSDRARCLPLTKRAACVGSSNCMADPPGLLTDYTRPSYSSSRLAVFPWIGTISRNVELPGLVFRHFRSVWKITHSCTWTKDSSPNLINHCSERLIPFQYHTDFVAASMDPSRTCQLVVCLWVNSCHSAILVWAPPSVRGDPHVQGQARKHAPCCQKLCQL